jgi:prepilin-type N-terminal cleavage/methylation domain-containing protein
LKRAFTLIELLVVIAIIAILAAILFPVFAQAKIAAKKTVAISGQKQIALGMLLYTGDYDDTYPRQDGCENASSLNTALNTLPNASFSTGCAAATPTLLSNGTMAQVTTANDPFAYGINHFSWQKWVMPYVKSVNLFFHPGKGIVNNSGQWTKSGEIEGSFALNVAVTGALFVRGKASSLGVGDNIRDSYWGGTTTGMPSPAENMLTMETSDPTSAVIATLADSTIFSSSHASEAVNYPWAIRETWMREFYNWTDHCTTSTSFATTAATVNTSPSNVNNSRLFAGGVTCGFVDGHAKFVSAGDFLAKTPSAAEYVQTTSDSFGGRCGIPGASGDWTGTPPNMHLNYPFWGLSSQ